VGFAVRVAHCSSLKGAVRRLKRVWWINAKHHGGFA
jgi:hypothetical protein